MSTIVLVGGGIGCGKTTLINFILKNKIELFRELNEIGCNGSDKLRVNCCVIQFDSLCSIEEQECLMKSMKGLRHFRADLLMAAERFITLFIHSENGIAGPLTERSYNLLSKLKSINNVNSSNLSNTVIFVEDNFYYRSMRYDWLQIARRTNLGFATVFLQCPLNVAIHRNSTRGYQIPEDRIKKMLSFIEYPDAAKFKWEKMSVIFDSSPELTDLVLTDVINVIKEAIKNPVELVILEEKIEAQKICSKNVIHQSDRILRKIVSKIIASLKTVVNKDDDENLKTFISFVLKIRQKLFCDIKQGTINLPEELVDKIQNLGIESVLDSYEKWLYELFIKTIEESNLDLLVQLNNLQIEEES